MSQMLHIEIPCNFGNTVLGLPPTSSACWALPRCVHRGSRARPPRPTAVLAASSLYFRDLSSGNSKSAFELPGTVPPPQQILSFCYTGRLTMAASEQLVVMGYGRFLQIQHIVERAPTSCSR